jgi:hypothetical protein
MKAISSRTQWWLIGATYAFVLLFGGSMAVQRYIYEYRHPNEVTASSGMWAFGDMMMWVMIFFMALVPTVFMLRLVAKSEGLYTSYSKIVLAFAITAPLCIGLVSLFSKENVIADACLWRLIWSPLILITIAVSRIVAKFKLSKRLLSYALLTEGLTLTITITLFFMKAGGSH